MPVLALLLALIVFVPDVAVAGAWASPTPVTDAAGSTETTGFAPAQLVRPAHSIPPVVPQVLLLVLVAASLVRVRPPAGGAERRAPVPKPGRFGRFVLYACLL